MKTIAVSIEADTVRRLDRLLAGKKTGHGSRSALVRQALADYLRRVERALEEEREREIFRSERRRLQQEAAALIADQAEP